MLNNASLAIIFNNGYLPQFKPAKYGHQGYKYKAHSISGRRS